MVDWFQSKEKRKQLLELQEKYRIRQEKRIANENKKMESDHPCPDEPKHCWHYIEFSGYPLGFPKYHCCYCDGIKKKNQDGDRIIRITIPAEHGEYLKK